MLGLASLKQCFEVCVGGLALSIDMMLMQAGFLFVYVCSSFGRILVLSE